MIKTSIQSIELYKKVLLQLTDQIYSAKTEKLFGASIGEHTRHVIELYRELLNGYTSGIVCYDRRKRDMHLEQDLNFALNHLEHIQKSLEMPDKIIDIVCEFDGQTYTIPSSYFREIIYNLEHLIHHEAIIKESISNIPGIELPAYFGIAPSTIKYKSSGEKLKNENLNS